MIGEAGVGYEMNSFEFAIHGSLKDFLMTRLRNKEYIWRWRWPHYLAFICSKL